MLLKYKVEIENLLDMRIKKFRFDRWVEYVVNIFKDFYKKNDVIYEFSDFYFF